MSNHIIINGEKHALRSDTNISALIETLALTPNTFAIAVNDTLVPKSHYMNTLLKPNDRIEIVSAMQGG